MTTGAHESLVPPTDIELMMLVDGELEPARQAEIEAYLAASDGAGGGDGGAALGKLAGLRAVGAVVAATAAWPERSVDVTDDVLRRVGTAPAPRASLDGAARSRRSGSVAPAAPANDNSRLIFGLALAAAAAAAGVFVWGRGGEPADELATRLAPSAEVAERSPTTAPAPTDGTASAVAAAPTGEPAATGEPEEARYGVEVASVDFGQRSGAIYYVPAGGAEGSPAAGAPAESAMAAAVTTVVWLTDE